MLQEKAFAKVNLTLAVIRRRADGYHDLESLTAFAQIGDSLDCDAARPLSLAMAGPGRDLAGPTDDNLVLKAARLLAAEHPGMKAGAFRLRKVLPVAAGLGGGSADAAAALRILAALNDIAADDPLLHRVAKATGADVPVCLASRARIMRGIGDELAAPLVLPKLHIVLVNPRRPVPTGPVFQRLAARRAAGEASSFHPLPEKLPTDRDGFIAALKAQPNDLEAPAIDIEPSVATVIDAIAAQAGVLLARMSGSGATCFGLFATRAAARAAAATLSAQHPQWWVRAGGLQ